MLCWSNCIKLVVINSFTNFIFCKVDYSINGSYFRLVCLRFALLRVETSSMEPIHSYTGKHLLIGDFNQVEYPSQNLGGGGETIRGAQNFT